MGDIGEEQPEIEVLPARPAQEPERAPQRQPAPQPQRAPQPQPAPAPA
ncbi:hypothetical protein [uncultured Jatrophihabitans sp.]